MSHILKNLKPACNRHLIFRHFCSFHFENKNPNFLATNQGQCSSSDTRLLQFFSFPPYFYVLCCKLLDLRQLYTVLLPIPDKRPSAEQSTYVLNGIFQKALTLSSSQISSCFSQIQEFFQNPFVQILFSF